MLAEAFRISRSDRPGPVLIDLPKDVQNADARHLPSHRPLAVEPPPVPVAQTLATAAERLARSHRPVIYGGGGIALGGAVEAFRRSEEHTSELQSLMRTSYADSCVQNKRTHVI